VSAALARKARGAPAPAGVTRFAALALALLCSAGTPARAAGANCLTYEPDPVSIRGHLAMKVLPGPPHYQSFEGGDQPEPVWLLTPEQPFCVDGIPNDSWSVAQARIDSLQVIARTRLTLDMSGRTVRIDGTLKRPHNAHARAPLVLQATSVINDPN
jgi:hypothetical protein